MGKSIIISFFSFIIITVISIVIILYANGNIFNINSKQIEKIGILKITSNPTNSEVFINNSSKGNTPLSLYNLNPGIYTIEIRKGGYQSWKSKVEIKGRDLVIVNGVLYNSHIISTLEENKDIKETFFGINTYAYKTENTNGESLFIHSFGSSFFNLGENTNEIFNTKNNNISTDYSINSVNFSKDGSKVLVKLTSNIENKDPLYYIASIYDTNTIELTNYIDSNLYTNILWGENSNQLIFSSNKLLVTFDINTKQKILIDQENKNDILKEVYVNNKIYYEVYQNDDIKHYNIYHINNDGTNKILLTKSNDEITNFITDYNNEDYAYGIKSDSLYLYTNEDDKTIKFNFNNEDITPISFSNDLKYLLLKIKDNYYTYIINEEKLYRLDISSNISSIKWDNNSDLLVYIENKNNFYSLNVINFDNSNKINIKTENSINNDGFTISPNNDSIIIQMQNTQNNTNNLYNIDISKN